MSSARTPASSSGAVLASAQGRTPREPHPAAPRYVGRFAPSPTGALHFGSLVAAVGSYLSARSAEGEWLVRIEDLDPPREVPGSVAQILRSLEAMGFQWPGPVLRQSTRSEAYEAALEVLLRRGLAFPCSCSRSELPAQVSQGAQEELHYPGWCRAGLRRRDRELATRFRVPDEPIEFCDLIQGPQTHYLSRECGDFVIKRRDGLFAYQLAVVVDDSTQGVTSVVRGADLLSSTPRQIALQGALGLPTPTYAHLPVATDRNGIKLSKSAGAATVNLDQPSLELWRALDFLRQAPPPELKDAALSDVWAWAIRSWRVQPLIGLRSVAIDGAT